MHRVELNIRQCILGYNETQDASSPRSGEADSSALEFCDAENTDSEEYTLPDDFPEGGIHFNTLKWNSNKNIRNPEIFQKL